MRGWVASEASGPQPTGHAATTETRAAGSDRRRHLVCRVRNAVPAPTRKDDHGSRHHAPAPRRRRALRAPDPSVEPEDEALHPDRAQRYLHHRPAADAGVHRPCLRLRQEHRRARRHHPVRRHQATGTGGHRERGGPCQHALRQPALVGRHAHELLHRAQASAAAEGPRSDGDLGRVRRPHQERGAAAHPREGQARQDPRRHPRHGQGAQCHLGGGHQEGAHRRGRGSQAGHPGRGRAGHQLRSGRGGLPAAR